MTSKNLILALTRSSAENLFRFAHVVPEDKLDWQPGPDSRSVLSVIRECAMSVKGATKMLAERKVEFNPEAMEKARAEQAKWTTIDDCEQAFWACFGEFESVVEAFPDEDMEKTLFLPFTQKEHPFWEMMMYPYWNNVWHTGQVGYIQTLYGDTQMH